MGECCCPPAADAGNHPKKRPCPANGREYLEVSPRTIAHHLREPWNWTAAARYYFCDDPACDVVYFGDDGSLIRKGQLRTAVGIKESGDDAPLCYCFGVTRADFKRNPAVKDFVTEQARAGQCACETRNPSGRCCLKDFPKSS